jgi:hypothetical protein
VARKQRAGVDPLWQAVQQQGRRGALDALSKRIVGQDHAIHTTAVGLTNAVIYRVLDTPDRF